MTRTMAALPSEGFLLEFAPGRLVVGAGPLEARACRRAETLACYAPDFLLADERPWLHPTTWRETTRDPLCEVLDGACPPHVAWEEPEIAEYAARFSSLMDRIDAGALAKAVPVILEHGTWQPPSGGVIAGLLRRALAASGPSFVYAAWTATSGIVGASPEVLFVREDPGRVETVAMAGTYPDAHAADLPADPKETREHASVVDDIVAALSPMGAVSVGAREVVRLPAMAHLKTDIAVAVTSPVTFGDLVRALHPTAALGVAPRSAGTELMPSLGPSERGRFGAPFGIEWPDGRAHVLVAIRNVQWNGPTVTLGAGAGILAESQLEREWEELRLKRSAVKDLLGL
jgi:menaquinone-specific isochorismate synthase